MTRLRCGLIATGSVDVMTRFGHEQIELAVANPAWKHHHRSPVRVTSRDGEVMRERRG